MNETTSCSLTGQRSGHPAPGHVFYAVHACAVVSLTVSTVVSLGTLIYLMRSGKRNIWKRRLSERLVIYLAMIDLFFSLEHTLDHVFPLITGYGLSRVSRTMCEVSAFILTEFTLGQGVIVCFSAFCAFVTVSRRRRVNPGKFDWILLLLTVAVPAVPATTFLLLGYMGPSDFWCFADMTEPRSSVMYDVLAIMLFIIVLLNIIFYSGVWLKVKKTTALFNDPDADFRYPGARSYVNTAKLLSLFVVAYFIQWLPLFIFSVWRYVTTPPLTLVFFIVTFCNLGGVFNFIAYTYIRKRLKIGDGGQGSASASLMDLKNHIVQTPTAKPNLAKLCQSTDSSDNPCG